VCHGIVITHGFLYIVAMFRATTVMIDREYDKRFATRFLFSGSRVGRLFHYRTLVRIDGSSCHPASPTWPKTGYSLPPERLQVYKRSSPCRPKVKSSGSYQHVRAFFRDPTLLIDPGIFLFVLIPVEHQTHHLALQCHIVPFL
jgi:hypothetical protein